MSKWFTLLETSVFTLEFTNSINRLYLKKAILVQPTSPPQALFVTSFIWNNQRNLCLRRPDLHSKSIRFNPYLSLGKAKKYPNWNSKKLYLNCSLLDGLYRCSFTNYPWTECVEVISTESNWIYFQRMNLYLNVWTRVSQTLFPSLPKTDYPFLPNVDKIKCPSYGQWAPVTLPKEKNTSTKIWLIYPGLANTSIKPLELINRIECLYQQEELKSGSYPFSTSTCHTLLYNNGKQHQSNKRNTSTPETIWLSSQRNCLSVIVFNEMYWQLPWHVCRSWRD